MGTTKDLLRAKKEKNDEFYTQLSDIENELRHYKKHFIGKVVFCNCDDPEESNFWNYFSANFTRLGIKKLISTHFDFTKATYKLEMEMGDDNKPVSIRTPLSGNGDFRSPECIDILQEVDIVVTNPPFSLFQEYLRQLVQYEKKFVIVGSLNAMTNPFLFNLIRDNKVWLGYGFKGDAGFFINRHYEDYATSSTHKDGCIRVPGVCWLTNLDIPKRHEDIILWNHYDESKFEKYSNLPSAIEVGKVKDIPDNYDGLMGVPITFLKSYNPTQFDIVGLDKDLTNDRKRCCIGDKTLFARIIIKKGIDKTNKT